MPRPKVCGLHVGVSPLPGWWFGYDGCLAFSVGARCLGSTLLLAWRKGQRASEDSVMRDYPAEFVAMSEDARTAGVVALGDLIGQQADLLWAAATALLVAQFYLVSLVFDPRGEYVRKSTSWLLYSSIGCYVLSMLFGYMARGAIITLVEKVVSNKKVELEPSFSDAEVVAFLQFGLLIFGIVLFTVFFAYNRRCISRFIRRETHD